MRLSQTIALDTPEGPFDDDDIGVDEHLDELFGVERDALGLRLDEIEQGLGRVLDALQKASRETATLGAIEWL
jgi:hypothetical protein